MSIVANYVVSFVYRKWKIYVKLKCTDVPQFTDFGIDMFGPYNIRERQSDLKSYCALFTCFTSRAVHIEVTNALDTDSFTQELRRFMGRQGPVKLIRSDNGTNFVGTANELRKTLDEMNHEQLIVIFNVIFRRAEVTGSLGTIIHLLLHIWEKFGSAKFELPGQNWMPCIRLIHSVEMMKNSGHY